MEILRTSENVTKNALYNMTKAPDIEKVSENAGLVIMPLTAWAIYEDTNAKGETMKLLSMLDDSNRAYATNSATFIRDFEDCLEIFGNELTAVQILAGTSKAGRTFYSCKAV